jgi:hypothetical protein
VGVPDSTPLTDLREFYSASETAVIRPLPEPRPARVPPTTEQWVFAVGVALAGALSASVVYGWPF